MKSINRYETKGLTYFDQHFFKYILSEASTIDEICAKLQIAVIKGNGDYMEHLFKETKTKDLMQLANYISQI